MKLQQPSIPHMKQFYNQITKSRELLNGYQFMLEFFGPS